jgi:regulator of protease activity HflC (stomatin/prohibitin superfamily)
LKNQNKLLFVFAITVLVFVTGCTTINPGSVGVIVNKYGNNRGVQDYTTTTGFVAYNPISTTIEEFPTSVQTVQWTATKTEGNPADESITFTTKESVSVNADISLSYQIDAAKVPYFYVKFRNDDLNSFTYGYLHNISRDAMNEIGGQYTVEQVMGDNGPFLAAVRAKIQGQVADIGVNLQQFGFIGAARPPENIVRSINAAQQAKYAAIQTQNELAQTQAEAAKTVAQAEGQAKANIAIADGQAKANTILAGSITENLLKKQALDLQAQWIDKWNGKRPEVESGTGSGFMLTLPAPSK